LLAGVIIRSRGKRSVPFNAPWKPSMEELFIIEKTYLTIKKYVLDNKAETLA
jgi:hypothetical protein